MSLLAWYPFNGTLENKGLDNVELEPMGQVNYSIGKITNKSLSFETHNVNDRIRRDLFPKVDDFSWSCWLNLPDYTEQQSSTAAYILGQGRQDVNSDGWGMQMNINENSITIRYADLKITLTFTSNVWFHLACTINSNNEICVYMNGNLKYKGTTTIRPDYSEGNGKFAFGCFTYASGDICPGTGKIQDFRYYDECLSPLQIREISKGLILHYNFEDPIVPYTNTDYDNLFSQYNNYKNSWGRPEEMASTSQVLDETFEGHRIYRITLTPTGNDGLTSITTMLRNQGVCFANSDTSYKTFYIDPDQYAAYGLLYRVVSHQHNQVSVGGTAANKFSVSQTPVTHYCDNWYRVGQIKKNTTSSRNSDGVYISIMCPSLQLNESVVVDFCQPEEYLDCISLPPRAYYNRLPETIIKDSSGYGNDASFLPIEDPADSVNNLFYNKTFTSIHSSTTLGSDTKGNYFINSSYVNMSGIIVSDIFTSVPDAGTYIFSIWLKPETDMELFIHSENNDADKFDIIDYNSCYSMAKGVNKKVKLFAHKWTKIWVLRYFSGSASIADLIQTQTINTKIYYRDAFFGKVNVKNSFIIDRDKSEGQYSYHNHQSSVLVEKNQGNIGNILTNNQEFTISFWAKTNSADAVTQYLFTCGYRYGSDATIEGKTTGDDRDKFLHLTIMNNKKLNFGFCHDDLNSNYEVLKDEWHFYTYVLDNSTSPSTRRIYIDGELDSSNTTLGDIDFSDSFPFTIGASFYPATSSGFPEFKYFYPLYGNIDDFRIYTTVLSSEDIKKMCEVKARMDDHNNVLANNFIEYNKIELLGDEIKQCLEDGHDSASALYRYDAQTEVTNTYENGKLHITRRPNSTGAQSTNYAGWSITNLRNVLQANHTYLFEFDMEGYNDGNVPLDRIYLTYKPGWNTVGGLSATNIGNWMHSNYEGYTHYQTKFTLKSSWMWKTATKTESDVISGESYPCHDKIFVNLTYAITGSRGTDLYFYNIHLYDITESKDINIDKKYNVNLLSTNQQIISSSDLYDMPIKQLDDGSIWARIFYHNSKNGTVLFSSDDEALNCNTVDKYSKLYLLSDSKYKGTDGKFEFMYTQPTDTMYYNRWKQTNSPLDETQTNHTDLTVRYTVTGYEPIHIDCDQALSSPDPSRVGLCFGGLAKNTLNPELCLLNGLVGHTNWWFAIGAKTNWNNGVPGLIDADKGFFINSNGQTYNDTELWLRVDNTSIDKIELDRIKMNLDRSITANDFIEI